MSKEEWLIEASEEGDLKKVKRLVKAGADIHAQDDKALRWSAGEGHVEIVEYLIEQGADIHVNDDWALKNASYENDLEIVKYLVKQGVDDNACEEALEWAQDRSSLKVVNYLKSTKKENEITKSISMRDELIKTCSYITKHVKKLTNERLTYTGNEEIFSNAIKNLKNCIYIMENKVPIRIDNKEVEIERSKITIGETNISKATLKEMLKRMNELNSNFKKAKKGK